LILADPGTFDLSGEPASRHLGFATGVHFCLGLHLARLETKVAIQRLLLRLPKFEISEPDKVVVEGYEFRQPNALFAKCFTT
jgi:cytochrome P450